MRSGTVQAVPMVSALKAVITLFDFFSSLFGIESSGWAVVTVNFSNVFPRMCENEDYYNWVPFDQVQLVYLVTIMWLSCDFLLLEYWYWLFAWCWSFHYTAKTIKLLFKWHNVQQRNILLSLCLQWRRLWMVNQTTITWLSCDYSFHSDYGYKHANGYSGRCIRDEDVTLLETCGDGVISYIQSQG